MDSRSRDGGGSRQQQLQSPRRKSTTSSRSSSGDSREMNQEHGRMDSRSRYEDGSRQQQVPSPELLQSPRRKSISSSRNNSGDSREMNQEHGRMDSRSRYEDVSRKQQVPSPQLLQSPRRKSTSSSRNSSGDSREMYQEHGRMDIRSRYEDGSRQQQILSPQLLQSPRRKSTSSSRNSSGDSREMNQEHGRMDTRSRYEDGSRQQQVPSPQLVQSPRKKSTSSSSGDSREMNEGRGRLNSRSRYEDGSRHQEVPSPELLQSPRTKSTSSSSGDSREMDQGQGRLDSRSRYEDCSRQQQVPSPELLQSPRKKSSSSSSGDSREMNKGQGRLDSRSRYEDGSRQQQVPSPELLQSPRTKSSSSSSSGDSREMNQGQGRLDSRSRYEDCSRQQQVPSPELLQSPRKKSSSSSSGDSREMNKGQGRLDSRSRYEDGSRQQQVPSPELLQSPRKKSSSSSSGDSREMNKGQGRLDSRSRYEDGSRQQQVPSPELLQSPRKKSTSSSNGDSREMNQGQGRMDNRSRYEDGSRQQQVPSPQLLQSPQRKSTSSSRNGSGDSREMNHGQGRMDSRSRYEDGSQQQQVPSPQLNNNSSNISSGDSSDDESWAEEEGGMSVLDSAAVTNMINIAGHYAKQLLLDTKGRHELRSRCSARLQEEHGVNVQYAEQAVLANLDWGIDGLEKAVKATNPETRAARLEHTEKMLQVAVLLDPKRTTAGVPNSYLSAWASYYMALVWKLRNNDRNAAVYLLDVFVLEPFHARTSFVPELWEDLFLPHMANIEAWYRAELEQIKNDSPPLSSVAMFPIPKPRRSHSMDSTSHSRSLSTGSQAEFKDASGSSSPSRVETSSGKGGGGTEQQQQKVSAGGNDRKGSRRTPSLAPDQVMRLELLNKLYQDSLNENTKQYAQYYKDWMVYEAADEDGLAGAGDNTEPSFPRIINPSLMNPSSFTGLQPGESTSQAGPSGRSSVAKMTSAANGAFNRPDAGDFQVLEKRAAPSRKTVVDSDNDSFTKASQPRRTSMDRDSDSFTKVAQPRQTSMDRDNDSLTRAAEPRRTSMDRDNDSFTKSVHFPEVDAFPSNDSNAKGYQVPDGEEGGNGDGQGLDLRSSATYGIVMDDQDDGTSVGEVDKGAGVYLDGEQLTEDELLQVWEEISEGRISTQEANDFINQLTDKDGQPLDFQKLSEFADAVRPQRLDHQENQQAEIPGSPDPDSVHNKYTDCLEFDIEEEDEEEEEEAEVKIRQEFDRPDSPGTLSRLNSLSFRSPISPISSRNNLLQVQLYSQEQPPMRPPKDFVCPITNQLFHDPVTLETGQTYERGAIKEWFDRGNTTCPITRHMLKNPKLPKTNYVLKRLVDNWKDDHPEFTSGEATLRASSGRLGRPADGLELEVYSGVASPPNTRFSRASVDDEQRPSRRFGQKVAPLPLLMGDEASSASLETLLRQLRSAVEILFRTEDLAQCERAALMAAQVWVDSKCDDTVAANLSKAGVVEGLIEVLSSSKNDEVLRSIVCLFSDLISKDEFARHTILRTDPEIESIVSVLKNARVPQVAVLLHLLKVPAVQLSALKIVPFLVAVVKHGQFFTEGTFTSLSISPKAAAVYILEQLATTLDHRTNRANAEAIVRAEGVPALMERLEAKTLEEKISAVAVLFSCLQSDGSCRTLMVQNLKMSNLIELFHNSKEQARTVAIFFLAELIRLNRRRVIEKVLQEVLEEGVLNSMHILMLHLQMSPLEHRPLVAGLLLQLDVLADPQKHSVYREEAVEALVDALHAEDKIKVQLEAAKALASLSGRYSNKGKSATESSLLKAAGFEDDNTHNAHSPKSEHRSSSTEMSSGSQDEKKAADDWDRRMAMAVLGSGKSLIEALGEALPSKSSKIVRPCLVATAWLTSSLRLMPDPSLLSFARNCFLSSLVSILRTAVETEVRVLACLSLHNLTDDAAGVQQLMTFSKDLLGPLRRSRRYTWTARKLLETLAVNPFTDLNTDVWEHGEVCQMDNSRSGETRVLYYFRGYLYSGHSDASIKSWALKGRTPRLVQEVREHSRPVLCLTGLETESKLFSGSADKTVRIWLAQDDDMRCVQVIDAKEAVHCVAVNSSFICLVPQGVGIKVFDSTGSNPRVLNSPKHVQTITFGDKRMYCGCTDSSIQEIDPVTGTSVTIQSGVRSLRGRKAIYSLTFFDNQLVAGGSNIDGIAFKMWKIATRSLVASITTQIDVRVVAMSEDLVYLASPTGVVEVWLLEKDQKVATFSVGSKILSLAIVGETLYIGSADGIIRAWTLV